MDVSTVKAEIKAWERSFKSLNGRDPSIQDIKLQPDIANKYKLYKKLSKTSPDAFPSTSTHNSSDPPSTPPPRSRPRSHQPLPTLLTQSRVVETTAPLSSFNPFSPQKNKGKGKVSAAEPRPHPFASPFKFKAPAVDLLPTLNLTRTSASSVTPPHSPLTANSAISRARKRLRGEPVSPSPSKGKRRRVGSQTSLPFAKFASDSSSSEDEAGNAGNSSFVSDSPVKVPAGGRSFKLLFDEAGGPRCKAPVTRTNSTPLTSGLFGEQSAGGLEDDAMWDLNDAESTVDQGKFTLAPLKPYAALAVNGSTHISKANIPTNQRGTRKTAKRSLSDAESEVLDTPHEPVAGPSLLPPSPPPADCSTHKSRQSASTRARGSGIPTGRKKAKTVTDHDKLDDKLEEYGDDSDTLKPNVKIIDRTQTRSQRTTTSEADEGKYDLDSDPDPILEYTRRIALRIHKAAFPPDVGQEGKFEVDLPDKLRRVLALESKESKLRDVLEERVVQGLIFGRRTGHYDPAKGGEIWDVGEDDLRHDEEARNNKDAEGEDEWEGEPVLWQVGEL